jgi:hypothetical protein
MGKRIEFFKKERLSVPKGKSFKFNFYLQQRQIFIPFIFETVWHGILVCKIQLWKPDFHNADYI